MAPRSWATHPSQDTHQRQRETDQAQPTGLAPALNDVDALLEGIENAADQEAVVKQAREARQLLDVIWIAHNGQ
jgi:hypothetical protein